MIQTFVERFDAQRAVLEAAFSAKHPESYKDIVAAVVRVLSDDYGSPDPDRIVEVDHGHYQGTLLYIVGATGYQPDRYWAVKVGYGSCSGCDTFQDIRGWEDTPPTAEQVKDYMTLALHIVQKFVEIGGDEA